MQKIRILKIFSICNFRSFGLILSALLASDVCSQGQAITPACTGQYSSDWTGCVGSYVTNAGNEYTGEFKNGKKYGRGILIFKEKSLSNGDKYIGEWREDKPNGIGIYYFQNGNRYEGDFRDGKRSGIGAYFKLNDQLGLGEWKNNKPHGEFIEYRSFDYIANAGVFEDGILLKRQTINPTGFLNYLQKNIRILVNNLQSNQLTYFNYKDPFRQYAQADDKLNTPVSNSAVGNVLTEFITSAVAEKPDSDGTVMIRIATTKKIKNLQINSVSIEGEFSESISVKQFARIGVENFYVIEAVDFEGNASKKIVSVFRHQINEIKTGAIQLEPNKVKQQPPKDAVAIIIGIEKYKRVAKADYASADAQVFYDYASRAFGIKNENIKLLVDDGAEDVDILQAFQNWLPLVVKKGKTDVYVFFSGHGYPSDDGKGLYFLPYGVDKNFMERTAVKQKEVVSALQAVQPKTVTIFIDSCYSGQIRGGDTLVAGAKPIAFKQNETAYPADFTVITASSLDQISWSSPDLKHGLFSYFLMKGFEGEADLNKDGKITAAEIQEYLTDMVGRQAMGMNRKQQPQLFGDADRVLVGK